MLQERRPSLSIKENVNRGVVSIDIENPGALKEIFWKELLEGQIKNCDGKRTFILLTAANDPNGINQSQTFTNREFGIYLQLYPDNIDNIVNIIRKAVKVTIINNG